MLVGTRINSLQIYNLAGSAKKEDGMLQYEYARPVLDIGLKLEKELVSWA